MTRNKSTYPLKNSISKSLDILANRALPVALSEKYRIAILSDMHVGNGGRGDDFRKNGDLCMTALNEYYLAKGFTLILNGDIEELHRFALREVEAAWPSFYRLLEQFGDDGRLMKTIGNHDILLPLHKDYRLRRYMHEAICLHLDGENRLFVFHGHQASTYQTHFNLASGVFLRFVARPFGIKSYSVSADKSRQFKLERKVYDFASGARMA